MLIGKMAKNIIMKQFATVIYIKPINIYMYIQPFTLPNTTLKAHATCLIRQSQLSDISC